MAKNKLYDACVQLYYELTIEDIPAKSPEDAQEIVEDIIKQLSVSRSDTHKIIRTKYPKLKHCFVSDTRHFVDDINIDEQDNAEL